MLDRDGKKLRIYYVFAVFAITAIVATECFLVYKDGVVPEMLPGTAVTTEYLAMHHKGV